MKQTLYEKIKKGWELYKKSQRFFQFYTYYYFLVIKIMIQTLYEKIKKSYRETLENKKYYYGEGLLALFFMIVFGYAESFCAMVNAKSTWFEVLFGSPEHIINLQFLAVIVLYVIYIILSKRGKK